MTETIVPRRKHSWLKLLERLVRYRLIVPLKRSKREPQHTARGVMVGVAWAMTPFFGVQMALVFLTWLISRKLFNWDFSLVSALAWTWVTNIFTLLPFFYAFYFTGQLFLGHFNDDGGYNQIKSIYDGFEQENTGFWDNLLAWLNILISDIGIPLTIGSVVWALICGWLSYHLTLRFVIRYRKRREAKTP